MPFKVTIAPQNDLGVVTGGLVTLCDSPDPMAAHAIQINGRPCLDLVDYLDAFWQRALVVGPRKFSLSFGTFRNKELGGAAFTSPGVAFGTAFDMAAFSDVVPDLGFVTIEADAVVRYIDRCGLQEIGTHRIKGVGIWQAYQLVGGTPLRTPPVEEP